MGIIKAAINAVTGALADTWLEVIESSPMGKNDVIVPGQAVDQRGRSQNKKGGENLVSNGSIIHVLDNQMMILVDGGKIVDYSATPGYFKVENSSLPSMFNGQLKENIKESFSRIKYAGISSTSQRVFFINLQEIRDLQFGTQNPVQYFDEFYEAELFMRLHGTFSVKITDPFKFYMEVIPKEVITNNESYAFNRQNMQQFFDEFVAALSAAFNQYSADGNRISHITSKGPQMAKYMQDVLDADWTELRGLEIVRVAMQNPAYDDASQKIVTERSKMASQVSYLKDAANQQAFMAKSAQNMGAGVMGGYMQNPQYAQQPQQAPQAQQQPPQAPQQGGWTCECGAVNSGKFCTECGKPKPEAPKKRFCTNCGAELNPNAKFCPECGSKQ